MAKKSKPTSRRLRLEHLESRYTMDSTAISVPYSMACELYATSFMSFSIRADVDHDLRITPQDALLIINQINGDGTDTTNATDASLFSYDVDKNGLIQPLDVLAVINELNSPGQATALSLALLTVRGQSYDWDYESVVAQPDSTRYAVTFCTPENEIPLLGKRGVFVDVSTREVEFFARM